MRRQGDSILSEVLPAEERVIEAVVARYERVAPAVTRFARSLAGDDALQVRLGSTASAGEDEIVLDPGVFQAAYTRRAPVTPTEVALASALHEVIHLVATNFDERRPIPPEWIPQRHEPAMRPGEDDEIELSDLLFDDEPETDPAPVDGADDEPEPVAAEPVSLLAALGEAGGPAAEALFLAMEDARQEARFFSSFAGAWSVLRDLYVSSTGDALSQSRPLGQYALAGFLVVGGYVTKDQIQRRVEPHVAAALDDAAPFLARVAEADDPWEVGGLALQLLQIARLHRVAEEADAATAGAAGRRDLEQAEKDAIAESVDAVRIVTSILRDLEGYDETRQAARQVSAAEGRKDDAEQAGDPATDQIVRVSQSPTVYLPTGQGGKLIVDQFPERFRSFGAAGHRKMAEAERHWSVVQHRVSGELYPLFLANQRRGLRSGYDAGDLSPHAALLLGAGLYERMYERRDLATRRSYGVSLLIDGSASMLQPRPLDGLRKTPWALAAATLGAWTLARLADELQLEFEVALFNRSFAAAPDDTERSFTDRRGRATGALRRSQGGSAERLSRTVNHYLLKSFDQRWRAAEDVVAGLFWTAAEPGRAAAEARRRAEEAPPVSMFDRAANVDEYNVSYAVERLVARRVGTRILVVLADGMTRGSVQDLALAVSAAEHGGTVVLGIGIGDDTVCAAYDRNQVVERPDELARAMVGGVRSALYKTIAMMGGNTWWAHSSERALYEPKRSIHG